MNIVFWSKYAGRCATSGNMLAVSIMSSLIYSVKGILLQLDYRSRTLDDVFEGKRQVNLIMEEYAYYSKRGMDELMDRSQLSALTMKDVKENIIPIQNTSISYIPTFNRIRADVNDKDVICNSRELMKLLKEAEQYSFIDCVNGDGPMVKSVLENADVIVVNLCQGMSKEVVMPDKKLRDKCVYLVGRYDAASTETLSDICRRYDIRREDIMCIPYNIAFHDALVEGKVVQFLSKHISARRFDDNFDFINNVFKSTHMILKKAGYDETKY